MRFFLLLSCGVALIALSFVTQKVWVGGVGLLVVFASMWTDRDPVRLDDRENAVETTKSVRRMRSKDL